ncbi:hypothetical protein ATANTOWER_015116 [Ataeniobius toweri]|uniref:Uncharacterized protein n=1 Tax=Ataeniobius toweri TaxID=208326 RepID=A0ABU7C8C7_9TELE|nr:hypothetical protein [Ataeniobius toweri]
MTGTTHMLALLGCMFVRQVAMTQTLNQMEGRASQSCDLKAPISDLNILLEGIFYIISLILQTRFRAEEAFWMRDETSLKNKHLRIYTNDEQLHLKLFFQSNLNFMHQKQRQDVKNKDYIPLLLTQLLLSCPPTVLLIIFCEFDL